MWKYKIKKMQKKNKYKKIQKRYKEVAKKHLKSQRKYTLSLFLFSFKEICLWPELSSPHRLRIQEGQGSLSETKQRTDGRNSLGLILDDTVSSKIATLRKHFLTYGLDCPSVCLHQTILQEERKVTRLHQSLFWQDDWICGKHLLGDMDPV